MIRYYLIHFVRNLQRQKLFAGINLLGLTVSLISTLLIFLYVQHELSYDKFHHHADRIYRVNQTFIWGEDNNHQFASTGPGVAFALDAELPEAELITSLHTPGDFVFSYTNTSNEVFNFEENNVLAADSNFFRMFNFPLLSGDPTSALREVNTMVITESTAKKYFGDTNPIGKLIQVGNVGKSESFQTYEVTGVTKDNPDNSYIKYDVLLSISSFPVRQHHMSWVWTQLETFIRLDPSADIETTRLKLAEIPRKYADETLRRAMNTTYEEYIQSGKKWELFLQPLTSIHLPSEIVYNRINTSGNIKIVYAFAGVAAFIVLLSCINFMNLSTAQFTRRIKEASVRKILGLGKKELGISYFMEALAFCLIALILAIGFTQILLPLFNLVAGKQLALDFINNPEIIVLFIGLVLFMAIVSSFYPTVFLSSFHPVEAIKGKLKGGREGRVFRNSLVVFQFSISIILIICTSMVFRQLSYVAEKDTGFDKENLLVIKRVEGIKDGESFMQASLNMPGVLNSSRCTSLPPMIWGGDKFSAEGMDKKTFPLNYTTADERFIPTMDIKVKFGRNFSEDFPGDAVRVILNETAVRSIGWEMDESVVGKKIETPDGEMKWEVAGVVSDFNYWTLASPIEPLAIFHINSVQHGDHIFPGSRQFLVLRIAPQDSKAWDATFTSLGNLWKQHAGDIPFHYEFVDDTFAEMFASHEQFGKMLTILASLAILIASMGLLGMIIYSLEQRSKEIGIRKVSGANAWNILTLISTGYTKLIIIAFVIGAPVAWWIMQQWLSDFAYRTPLSLWVFLLTGVGTLLLAILITGYHSVKAALTNPVEVLKDE